MQIRNMIVFIVSPFVLRIRPEPLASHLLKKTFCNKLWAIGVKY